MIFKKLIIFFLLFILCHQGIAGKEIIYSNEKLSIIFDKLLISIQSESLSSDNNQKLIDHLGTIEQCIQSKGEPFTAKFIEQEIYKHVITYFLNHSPSEKHQDISGERLKLFLKNNQDKLSPFMLFLISSLLSDLVYYKNKKLFQKQLEITIKVTSTITTFSLEELELRINKLLWDILLNIDLNIRQFLFLTEKNSLNLKPKTLRTFIAYKDPDSKTLQKSIDKILAPVLDDKKNPLAFNADSVEIQNGWDNQTPVISNKIDPNYKIPETIPLPVKDWDNDTIETTPAHILFLKADKEKLPSPLSGWDNSSFKSTPKASLEPIKQKIVDPYDDWILEP